MRLISIQHTPTPQTPVRPRMTSANCTRLNVLCGHLKRRKRFEQMPTQLPRDFFLLQHRFLFLLFCFVLFCFYTDASLLFCHCNSSLRITNAFYCQDLRAFKIHKRLKRTPFFNQPTQTKVDLWHSNRVSVWFHWDRNRTFWTMNGCLRCLYSAI